MRAYRARAPLDPRTDPALLEAWLAVNARGFADAGVPESDAAAWLGAVRGGAVVTATPWTRCATGALDNLTFDNAGVRSVNDALVAEARTAGLRVVDLAAETAGECDATADGRHYEGRVRTAELEAILRATGLCGR